MDLRVQQYRIGQRLASGSFGSIYAGMDTQTMESVAIKMEPASTRFPQLSIENKVYNIIHRDRTEPVVGFPRVHHCGQEGAFNVLVMDMGGPSLEELFSYCQGTFSVSTMARLAVQMITRLQHLHSCGIIHRDIKPENFVMGPVKTAGEIMMVDFGLSKRYQHPTTKKHLPFATDKIMTGTARYASINAMKGCEQSRRDDLEALGYVLVYLGAGSVPWQGLPVMKHLAGNKRYESILKVKMSSPVKELCKNLPPEFIKYLEVVKALDYEEDPPYEELKGMFTAVTDRLGVKATDPFDWDIRRQKERSP